VNIGNAGLSWEAWCSLVKRRYGVFGEPLAAAGIWGVKKK